MPNNPRYKRILLKLSGEVLMGENDRGLSGKMLEQVANKIKSLVELKIEIAIVIGGGNFIRGKTLLKSGINRIVGDNMGMLATIINSLALADKLSQKDIEVELMSSIEISGVSKVFNRQQAIESLQSKKVCIFASGTGNPLFTTDTAACLRGIEVDADVVVKATKVDGVYDKDPVKFIDAIKFDKLTYDEVLNRKLEVMDLVAINLCQQHNMPLRVIDMISSENLVKMIESEKIGTLIKD